MKLPKAIFANALGISVFLSIVSYLGWTLLSDFSAALQSELHPILAAKAIAWQFTQAAPLSEWNIPYLSLGVWVVWLFGIYSYGISVMPKLLIRNPSLTCSGRAVIYFAVGFVIFAIAQVVFGSIGLSYSFLIPLFFTVSLFRLLEPEYRKELLAFPRAVIWQWRALPLAGRLLCTALLLPVFLLFVPALTPPVQSDGMRYHLGAVQEYLKLGAIEYLPHNAYSNMPFLVEMHFMGALALDAPEAAQLMHLTLALFTVLAIYSVGMHLSKSHIPASARSPAARWIYLLSAALYLGTPMSGVLATWPFTDHGMSFFLLASLLAALTCTGTTATWKSWALFGTCAGGLMGTKYTLAPVAVAIMAIPWIIGAKPKLCLLRYTIIGLATMAAVGGVWYLKNFLFTGNPFYPLGSQWFPGGEWTSVNDQFLHARAGAKGMGRGLSDLLLLPWNATFRWIAFEAHNPGATILIATLTALCALIPIASKVSKRERLAVFAIALLTFIIWFFTYQSNRLILPTIAVALALVPAHLLAQNRFARRLYSASVGLAVACGFAWAIQWSCVATALTPPPLPYLLGAQDRNSYRYQSLTYARAYDYLNQRAQPWEKILLIGEHRIYGAKFTALWSDWFDTPMLVSILRKNGISNVTELLAYLYSNNIRWIMINERELAPQLESAFRPWFTDKEWKLFEELRTLSGSNIKVINLPPGVTIYHLTEPDQ